MRKLTVVLMVMLCASCALLPFEIQKTPLKPDQAVVFDIDGTLTPSRLAIYTAREDAAKAVRVFADAGYKIIYLGARTQLFQSGIPNWLKENHFPEGSINVPQTDKDSSDHAAFKKRVLRAYKTNGWTFVAAYGDSSTDFEAYAEVGIKKDHVFALQRAGETKCEDGIYAKCLGSWTEHMDKIAQLAQP
jgi:phosphatidate phosphatase PAH1